VIPWYNSASARTVIYACDLRGESGTVPEDVNIREKKSAWFSWLVLTLCLLSFARGAYQLGEQSLWWDESLSLHRAARPFSFILTNRILFLYGTEETPITPDHHPPLYFVLLRMVVLAAGNSEFSLRYLSLAAGVLIVPLLFQCGRRLYDRASGLCAALLAACSPLYLWAQQEARPYALATLFGVMAFYGLLRMVGSSQEAENTRRLTHRRAWTALFFVSSAAMLVTHYHTLHLLPAYGVLYLLARGRRWDRTMWVLTMTAAVAGGIALYGLRGMRLGSDIPGYDFVPLGALVEDILRSFPLGVSGTRLVLYQWVAVGLLLAAIAVLLIGQPALTRRKAVYLLLCLVLPVGEIYVLSFVRPVYMNIRHVIFASPFYYLLLAAGVAQARSLWSRPVRWMRTASGAAIALTAVMLLVGMGRSTQVYFADLRYDKEDHRGWGRYLSEHVRPDDIVVVYPGAVYELYTYYTSSLVPYYGMPIPGLSTEQAIDQIVEFGRHYERLWIAHSLTPGWAYAGDITLEWLKDNALWVAFSEFHGHLNTFPVYAFRLAPPVASTLPDDASPVALDFGGELHLLGFRPVADPVEAGRPALMSLYWSAARSVDQEYRFTLSLKDEQGRSWSSLDYVPYRGTYSPARWPVQAIVRDDVDIDVPAGTPPGRYWVNVSVYPSDRSGPALPVQELDSGRLRGLIVPVAEITVTRPSSPPTTDDVSIPRPTRRRYGDVALLGHDYLGGTYRPGDTATLDLYWRALRTPKCDMAYALELADVEGDVQASRTIAPADGYPARRWQRRELVRSKHRFRVPIGVPEGDYTLWLAREEGNGCSSLWPWGDRRVRLGTLSVRPTEGERTYDIPPMQHRLRVALDDKVELLGYDLEESVLRSGQPVACTLYWRGLEEMDQDYTVFTHLIDPDGVTWGQWDNEPQQGQLPTTRWVPGQVVVDRYRIPLSPETPAGSLSLRVGMYDLRTMTRLPAFDQDGTLIGDAIAVAEIEIVDHDD
jgi:hypothetical protein